jgi:hypothetical protein
VSKILFAEEAEQCRRKALAYLGRPEASFLLNVARQFDRLEREGWSSPKDNIPN